MKIKGAIFDLDGVIVFTDKFHYKAWKEMADSLDIYFDEKINNRLRGVSRMDSLEIILENYHGVPLSNDRKIELAIQKNERYRELLKTMEPTDVTDDVRQMLIKLRERGIKISLGSSSKNARFILERVGLLEYFDEISDGNNITKSKPDPEVFIKAAQLLNLEPDECIVVEDAEAGIEAAIAGKMHSIAIGDAVNCGKAEFNIDNVLQILDII